MCGIFGIVGHHAPVPSDVLERATRSLAHRGPDDSGTLILRDSGDPDIEIGLGNRRLAILDLSPLGHQPMNDPANGNWIVYNGEVYNFREVGAKLQRAGVHLSGHSDTEVILKAYGQWGENCLQEFRGMFAFAIWDARRHRLFVARDPMGIKPLYCFSSDRYFIFSSEVRTLLGTGLVPREIDPAGLVSYLTFGSIYDPGNLVKNVQSLPAGSYLTWDRGKVDVTVYWDLIGAGGQVDKVSETSASGREKLEAEVAELLDESIRMQLVSDVPVGVFLSGGIDSSSLVGILSRSGVRPSTFSIVFREADYSEAEFSRAVAQHFQTDHHEITVSQTDFLAAIAPALEAMDLPTIDGINTYFVSERTRAAGVKVALSGLGGDEMYAGYASFRTVPQMERLANALGYMPHLLRELLVNIILGIVPSNDRNRRLAALGRNGSEVSHPYFLSRMLFTPEEADGLMGSSGDLSTSVSRAGKPLQAASARAQSLDAVNRVSYLESRCYMLNTLLRDSDFMSMAHGLEVRVPLIDHQLARRILALPGSWKLDRNTPKPLLVKALRGALPENIVHRPKRGFTLPFEHWMKDELRPAIEGALSKIEEGPLRSLIDPHAARRIWQNFLEGRTSWSRPWSLYVLQSWCERHISN